MKKTKRQKSIGFGEDRSKQKGDSRTIRLTSNSNLKTLDDAVHSIRWHTVDSKREFERVFDEVISKLSPFILELVEQEKEVDVDIVVVRDTDEKGLSIFPVSFDNFNIPKDDHAFLTVDSLRGRLEQTRLLGFNAVIILFCDMFNNCDATLVIPTENSF